MALVSKGLGEFILEPNIGGQGPGTQTQIVPNSERVTV